MLRWRTARPWTVRLRTIRRRTVRRNFLKRVDGAAESHDTHNTDNMDGAAELDTVSVINEGKIMELSQLISCFSQNKS